MANYLPEDWIEEVRSRNDIADVISEYLALKPSGRGFFGLCPFHNEKTASFHVYPEKQIYHCFGCGVGGNVFSFVMAMERLEFPEAVKMLAERAGMPLPNTMDAEKFIRSKDERDELYKLHQEAARFYHRQLLSQEGGQGLEYLQARGLDMKTIRAFGMGFAPDGWENIKKYLMDKNFSEETLIKSGIVVENNGRVYDRFRNRIMFPIIHPRGMVLGFGGRVMDDSLPKYLNSSDSAIFSKSNTLFGLNLVKKQIPVEHIIIVEGYMDVISLHQYGFKNAVASLGTSLTKEQAKILRRYASEVYIAYDGDSAGQKATLRGLDILQEAGCKVKVMQFPKGMDPDETLQKYGQEFFKKLMGQALSLVDYKLDQLQKIHDLETQDGRVSYASEAAAILVQLPNVLERDAHIQRLEALTGFKSRIIYQQIDRLEAKNQGNSVKENRIGNNRYTSRVGTQKILLPSNIKAERYLVSLMVQSEENAKKILSGLPAGGFEEELHKEVSEIVERLLQQNKDINPAQILCYIQDQEKVQQMVEIFDMEIEYDNTDKFIADCLKEIEMTRLERRRQELQKEIIEMDQADSIDPDKYRSILQEIALLNQKVKLGR